MEINDRLKKPVKIQVTDAGLVCTLTSGMIHYSTYWLYLLNEMCGVFVILGC